MGVGGASEDLQSPSTPCLPGILKECAEQIVILSRCEVCNRPHGIVAEPCKSKREEEAGGSRAGRKKPTLHERSNR
jgi:hypothetical protein